MISDIKDQIERISLSPINTIRETMQTINRGALGLALLIEPETKHFIGLVTDGDIRRALLKGYGLESLVSDIERPEARTARVGTPVDRIAAMFNEPVRVVPLLNENHQVVDLALFDRRMRLPVAEPSLSDKELQYVSECILTGWISSAGRFVTRFEQMLADYCGVRFAVATSNGTAALHLALLALDIGPGDEVVVPTLTFIATANAVSYTGARPVFVDSESETWNIDPSKIEEAVTSHTKAIIPVHLYGRPANMDPILKIALKRGLAVVEDAAEAHGARYKGCCVGSIGDMGIFSFYGNKIITTGEGGMIVTDNEDLAGKLRLLRDHGMSGNQRYWHPVMGYNYRLTNLQAAVGVAQMEKMDDILKAKRRIAQAYHEGLQNVSGISLQPEAPWGSSVCWLYSILVEPDVFGATRNEVMAALQAQNVETRPLFPPVHTQPIYNTGQILPVAERLAKTGLSLPSAIGLQQDEINRVIDTIITVGSSF